MHFYLNKNKWACKYMCVRKPLVYSAKEVNYLYFPLFNSKQHTNFNKIFIHLPFMYMQI